MYCLESMYEFYTTFKGISVTHGYPKKNGVSKRKLGMEREMETGLI